MHESTIATDRDTSELHAGAGRLENRLAAGSFASFVSFLVGIGTAIVQVPLLLNAWGEDTYGAWLLVTATYSLIISLDVGHQNYVANEISMLGLNDVASCRRVLGSAVKAACIIGIAEVAVALATVRSGVLSVWLPGEDPTHAAIRMQTAFVLITLTTYFALIGSIGGVLVRLYVAGGFYARSVWIGIVQRLAMLIALVGAASFGCSMASCGLVYVFAGSLVSIYTFYDLRQTFPAYWPWWEAGSLRTGLRQAASSLGLTATSVSDQVAAAGLLGIAGSRVHAAGVATLGTLRTLTNAILQAAGVLALPVGPDLSRFAAAANHEKASATLSALWLISATPLCLCVTCFQPFAGQFFQWWTRGTLSFPGPLFALLALGSLVRQWQMPMALFLFSANRVRPQVIISLVRTVALLVALVVGFAISSELTTAGVAALVAEVTSATAVVMFCRSFFSDLGSDLPTLPASLAGLQICVTAGTICTSATGMVPVAAVTALGVTLHSFIAGLQWATLPADVRLRITSLCRRYWQTQ